MLKKIFTIIYILTIVFQVNAQKEVRVGAFNYYPAIFKGSDGIVKGFYVDALEEIEIKENLKFVYVFDSWDKCLERIKNEDIDVMVSVAYTHERAQYMNYGSIPLLTVWGEVYVQGASDIDGIRDLENKKVAVMKEDVNAWYLKELTRKLSINCVFVECDGFEEIFTEIIGGRVDAGVVNNTFGAAKSWEYGIHSSGIVLNPFDIFFTVKKNRNNELLGLLNLYLKKWKSNSNSTYNMARQKWSHGDVGTIQIFPKWLKNATIMVVGILVVLVSFLVLLRYRVNVATRKVRNTEDKLSRAILFAPFPIMIHAEDGEVIAISDSWTEITGYTHKDIPTIPDWTEKAYRQKSTVVKEYIDRLYSYNKKIEDGEFEIFTSTGKKVIWDFSSAPLGIFEDGRRLVISMAKDVTVRKSYESELITAKERAVKSDLLKSAFLANMSHEIRTPMNGIIGFADLLKTPQLNSEKQEKYIQIITQSGKRMLNIINDIVDISKIESGLTEMNIQETNINEQLDEIYNFFKPEVEDRGVLLRCKDQLIKREEKVNTDDEKIFAVLMNLVKNALKYCERGFIDFGCVRKENCLEFYVKDTGIGIAKDRHQAIFERFIQADIYDVNARQGAGLGLAISKAYVEMLGGNIWVESEIGEGANFYFSIPILMNMPKEEVSFLQNQNQKI